MKEMWPYSIVKDHLRNLGNIKDQNEIKIMLGTKTEFGINIRDQNRVLANILFILNYSYIFFFAQPETYFFMEY